MLRLSKHSGRYQKKAAEINKAMEPVIMRPLKSAIETKKNWNCRNCSNC